MRIAVTGATGYIGRRLVCRAHAEGHQILAMTRKPLKGHPWLAFDLADFVEPDIPSDVDVVVHLAAITGNRNQNSGVDEQAAAASLMACSRKIGAHFVFVSSQTAADVAPTAYGRQKWRIEQQVRISGGTIIRPGQVYGGEERGLFGRIVSLVRVSPLLPAFYPRLPIQPIHVDDLADAILAACRVRDNFAIYEVAEPELVDFSRYLSVIAVKWVRRRAVVVPCPIVVLRMSRAVLGERLSIRFGLDRLLSLTSLPAMQTADDLRRLGVNLRRLEDGMSRSGNASLRNLLEEGHCLLTYIMRSPPPVSLTRRYVRYVQQFKTATEAIGLPKLCLQFPFLVSFLRNVQPVPHSIPHQIRLRLKAAISIADASPAGARRFMLLERDISFARRLLILLNAASGELVARICRPFLSPLLQITNPSGTSRK
ncbi:NAD-dependent epimerase/dehydratase family protein [Pseudohoeflea coraliihabitans]|uniref:Sugar nucleotide-binding protein n=1 Tax=Pseudohoeflea coraliihabitans TaxID=2860393 RepID=A0ABS6WLQ6_9HYPH|nr:sugar nucleotide-binding protein [Pseudohoeflea sp. DP4N28-3]